MYPQVVKGSQYAVFYIAALFLLLGIIACGEDRTAEKTQVVKSKTQDAEQQSLESRVLSPDSSWPMFMHDISYLGISPDMTLRPPLKVFWKFKTGGPVNSSPVVAGGTVYVGSDDRRIYALQARKWGVKWEYESEGKIIYAPTVYEDTVYFSARDNKVYALDAATGAEKWKFQADGWINAPIVAFRQRIYLGCYDNKIYILDAATGKRKSQELSSVKIGKFRYMCTQGEFYPVDARYRADKWRRGLPLSESWPATANGIVYIGARDSRLYAFESATRRKIWQFETDGWVDSSPAVADGMLYIGSRDGYVYAFRNAGSPSQQEIDRAAEKEGVVTHDRSRVYDRLDDKAELMAQLNEGRSLSVIDRKPENWYADPGAGWLKVTLPDGRTGWMSASDFITVRWSEDLQVNDPLVKDVKGLSLPQKAAEVSWSPDGSTVVFFDNISSQSLYWRANSVWLASGDGDNPTWVADGSFFNPRISWSGNSKWFAIENLARTQRQIWIARSNGTGLRKVAEGEAPALSPRDDNLAFVRRNEAATSVWVQKLGTGTEEKLAEIPIQGQESYAAYGYIAVLNLPAWSPGGSRLAVGLDGYHYPDNYSRVVLINAWDGLEREIAVRAARIRDVAWSPDGSHLAYVTQGHPARAAGHLDRQVNLIDLDRRDGKRIFGNCESIAWSPDGRYLAFIEENDCMGMRRKVWLLDVKSWQRIQLLTSREKIHRVFWLANGKVALLASLPPSETAPRTRGWIVSVTPPQ